MPRISPPKILGRCLCGEVLIENYFTDEPCWDRYEPNVKRMNAMLILGIEIEVVKCPGCGGDPSIRIGSFYHPRYCESSATKKTA